MMRENHRVLGVRKDASVQEIKAAYRSRARVVHPDRLVNASDAARRVAAASFDQLTRAYRELLTTATDATPGEGFRPIVYSPGRGAGFVPTVFRTATPTGGLVDMTA